MEESVYTISELDKLAVEFIDGELSSEQYKKLDTLSQFLVISLGSLYGAAKAGVCSGKKCAEYKYKLISEYKKFAVKFFWTLKIHQNWVQRSKAADTALTDLTFAVNSGNPKALPLALRAVDILSKQDVLLELFAKNEKAENMQAECIRELKNREAYYFERFGDIPFVNLISEFLKICNEENVSRMMQELDDDNIRKMSVHVPVKDDNLLGIMKSYKEIFKKN